MFCLVPDDGCVSFEPVGLARNGVLGQYVGGDLHDGQRGFELMGEIIDKILLDLRKKFLPVEIEQTGSKTDQCDKKDDGANNPEIHFAQDIFVSVWKIED